MRQITRARRVGRTAILCALVFRAFSLGLPGKLVNWMQTQEGAAFLIYLETGRDVRFSPSLEAFSPDFVESPPPLLPEPTIPAFSGEEEVEIYYGAAKDPDISALLQKELVWDLTGAEPTVLILSTHATESYTKQEEPYEEVSDWRTLDVHYNMLSLGAALESALEARGIPCLRDETLHDYPSYSGSYVSARGRIREILEEHPTIQLVLDLHRDASGGPRQMRTQAQTASGTCAQVMVVIGTNHDGYEENLSLGLKLHTLLEAQVPGITRPLQLRPQRFNQDLLPGCLILEIGAAGNRHSEALLALEPLTDAIAALSRGTAIPPSGAGT